MPSELVWETPRPVPELHFEDGSGTPLTLADFQGKVVLLNIRATWCAPCRGEMPTLDSLQAKLGGDRFEMVALAEMQRVLKPEGQFVFVEHGLSPEPRVAWWQHNLTPLWRRCAGGCRLNRQADVLLRGAGFELADLDTCYLGPPKTMTYTFEGRASPRQS